MVDKWPICTTYYFKKKDKRHQQFLADSRDKTSAPSRFLRPGVWYHNFFCQSGGASWWRVCYQWGLKLDLCFYLKLEHSLLFHNPESFYSFHLHWFPQVLDADVINLWLIQASGFKFFSASSSQNLCTFDQFST